MTSPIQTVLNAEAQARQEIEGAEKEARARISEARQRARQILQRNEARTTRVAKRYEALCERDLASKIEVLVNKSEMELEQFSHLPKADQQEIVEAVFDLLSPSSTGEADN